MIALANRTNRPTNLNFNCHQAPAFDDDAHQALIGSLATFFSKAGIAAPLTLPEANFAPFGAQQLELLLRCPPAVVSFHFGLPNQPDQTLATPK